MADATNVFEQMRQQRIAWGLARHKNPKEGQVVSVDADNYGNTSIPMIYLGGKWHQYGPVQNHKYTWKNNAASFKPSQELLDLLTRSNRYDSGTRRKDQSGYQRRMESGGVNAYIDAHDFTGITGLGNFLKAAETGQDLSAFTRVTGDPGDKFRGSAKNWGFSYLFGDLLNAVQYGPNSPIDPGSILKVLDAAGRSDILYGYKKEAGKPVREKLYEIYNQVKKAFPDANIPSPDDIALKYYLDYVKGNERGYVESVSHEQIFANVLNEMLNSEPVVQSRGGRFDVMSIPEISKMVADGKAAAHARHKARRDAEKSGGLLKTVLPFATLALNFVPGFQGWGNAIGSALGASGTAATALGTSLMHTGINLAGGKDFGDAALSGALSGALPALGKEFLPTTWGSAFGAGENGWNVFGFEVGKGLAGKAMGQTFGTVAGSALNSALSEYNASKDFDKLQKDIDAIYAQYTAQQQKSAAAQAATGITSPGWGVSFTQQPGQGSGPATSVGTEVGASTETSIDPGVSGRHAVAQGGGEGGMGTEEAALFEAPEGRHYVDPYQTIELMPGQAGRQMAQRGNAGSGWGRGISFV